jgi:uncharacterized protein YihD (DUF1040 family)
MELRNWRGEQMEQSFRVHPALRDYIRRKTEKVLSKMTDEQIIVELQRENKRLESIICELINEIEEDEIAELLRAHEERDGV